MCVKRVGRQWGEEGMEGGEQEYWRTNRVFSASSFGQRSKPVVLISPFGLT